MLTGKVDKPFDCYSGAILVNGYNIRFRMFTRYLARACEKCHFEQINRDFAVASSANAKNRAYGHGIPVIPT